MERESTKHSPRVDDQLNHEVRSLLQGDPIEAHSREDLLQEGPVGHPANRPDHPGTPPELSDEDVDLRSQLASSLRPGAFPADRDTLLAVARDEQATDEVIALIERLPAGVWWEQLSEVWERVGGSNEHRDAGGHWT